jgi:hypothetical protein
MRGIFCGIVGLLMAALLSQEPEFLQQYHQRLNGTIDVLSAEAQTFDDAARAQSLTRDQAIDRLKTGADPVAAGDGAQREAAFDRLDHLKRDRAELEAPGFLNRFTLVLRHLDRPIAEATMDDLVPALPLSAEGMFFAALGLLIGLVLSGGLVGLLTLAGRSIRSPRYRPKPAARRPGF